MDHQRTGGLLAAEQLRVEALLEHLAADVTTEPLGAGA